MSANAPENLDARPTLPPLAPRVRLTASAGNGTTSCDMSTPVVLIGGRRDCALPLPHPDVSKIHCAVVNTGRAVLVCDLLSRTGTFVNQELVRTAVLKPGDTLRVGPATIEVEFSDTPETPLPADDQGGAALLHAAAPLVLEMAGARVEIPQVAAVIGRRNTADVIIDSPDASLAHALLFLLDDRPAICDLGSRSGTFVNGQRVELSWLGDGDALEIGGEKLTLVWEPPPPPEAQSAASAPPPEVVDPPAAIPGGQPAAAAAADVSASQAALLTGSADLASLEQMIAAVQAQMCEARAQIKERRQQLDQREVEIGCRNAELDARSAALAQGEAGLQQGQADLRAGEEVIEHTWAAIEDRKRAFESEQAELAAARDELAQRREEFDALAPQLAEQRQQLEADQAAASADFTRIQETRTALEQQQQALNQASETCRQREEELPQRQAQLDASAAQLAQEWEHVQAERTALERRLTEQTEAAQRIEHFRSALQRTSDLFAVTATPGDPGAGRADETPSVAPRKSPPPAPPAADGAELPAPMVDQPLFTTASAPLPTDWPPQLCERYQVLRRVSNKSDEELRAQVSAEWAAKRRDDSGNKPRPKKKRRFSRGN